MEQIPATGFNQVITDELMDKMKDKLQGSTYNTLRFFTLLKHFKGSVNCVLKLNMKKKHMPVYPIHLREGMWVRNILRKFPECKEWGHEDYEAGWHILLDNLIDREKKRRELNARYDAKVLAVAKQLAATLYPTSWVDSYGLPYPEEKMKKQEARKMQICLPAAKDVVQQIANELIVYAYGSLADYTYIKKLDTNEANTRDFDKSLIERGLIPGFVENKN